MIHIGIDPGVNTGYAEWDAERRVFLAVRSMQIYEAIKQVYLLNRLGRIHSVTFEDARLRTGYFGPNAQAKQQGAGSVKRDCSIWAEFLGREGIPYKTISPRQKGAKVSAPVFAKLAKWEGRTNEHGRDAAMLVIGAQ